METRKHNMKGGEKTMQLQQGDVLIEYIEGVPVNATKLRHLVVARGETTGHQHMIVETEGTATLFEEKGTTYCVVENGNVVLYHGTEDQIQRQIANIDTFDFKAEDCHRPQTLIPGVMKLPIVREYDYEQARARQILD